MKRSTLLVATIALVLSASWAGAQAQTSAIPKVNPNWDKRLWPTTRNAPFIQMAKDPTKLFDNVYSVGLSVNNVLLITTNAGLVLIDSGWPETFDLVIGNIRTAGFDPANIKNIFITHAREDHFGAAGKFKQMVPGLRVGMSQADWEDAERQIKEGAKGQENSVSAPLTRDLVINDGESVKVGDQTFKFYVTPGTTRGALSIEFQAKDGGKSHRTLVSGGIALGGVAAGPGSLELADAYLKSIERLKSLGPWDALFGNHPFMSQPKDLGEIELEMATRGSGPNPAVAGPAKINAFFDRALKLGREKRAAQQKPSQTAGR